MADQQDIRKLGGLIKFLPFTYTIMLVGSLSLLATPWLSGFYSKDLIIELGYAHYGFSGFFAYVLGSITAGLTAFYSFRLISLTFLTYPNAKRVDYLNSHEADIVIIIPLTVLALFSIFFGYLTSDLFVGMASDFFGNSIFLHPNSLTLVEAEFSLPILIKLLPGILSLIGAVLGLIMYHVDKEFIISITDPVYISSIYKGKITHLPYNLEGLKNSNLCKEGEGKLALSLAQAPQSFTPFFPHGQEKTRGFKPRPTSINKLIINGVFARKLYLFLNAKFLFDILYNKYIVSGGLNLGFRVFKALDKGLVENIGPYGLANILYRSSNRISKADTGVVTTYSLYICIGILSLLFLSYSPLYVNSQLLIEFPGIELSNLFTSHATDILIQNGLNLEELDKSSMFLQPERLLIVYLGTLLLIYQRPMSP